MSDLFDRFVAISDLINNFEKVENLIRINGEVIIVKGDQFQYVLMPFDKYLSLNDKATLSQDDSDNKKLESLLNGIGKRVFIEHYYHFKNNDDPFLFLTDEFTTNSKRSRASKARAIFRNKMEHDALIAVINSVRTDKKIRNIASGILEKERNS